MNAQLAVALKVYREQFLIEEYRGEEDIFALVQKGRFEVMGENGGFTVGEGEGMLFRKDVFYVRRILSPVTMYLFRYTSDAPAFQRDHVIFHNQARIASAFKMLEMLEEAVRKDDFAIRRHIFEDLILLYALENGGEQKRDAKMETAVAAIQSTLHSGVDLNWIAQNSGLSYVQFLRRFKAYTGLTPSDYVTALRVQKAKSMLADTALRIKQIARACGFENEYYFSNFFKKHTSFSPSAFRGAAP